MINVSNNKQESSQRRTTDTRSIVGAQYFVRKWS